MKQIITALALIVLTTVFVVAQTSPRQMQKLQTEIEFEYANFTDKNRTFDSNSNVSLEEFLKFVKVGVNQHSLTISEPSRLGVTERGAYKFANGNTFIFPDIQPGFSRIVFKGTNVEINYVDQNGESVMLSFKLNDGMQMIKISENSVNILPLNNFDAKYKSTDFLVFRLISAKRMPIVCSISEIGDEIINRNNKNWKKVCFEAGNAELK